MRNRHDADQQAPRRGLLARIGICLLNLAHPGLGLIRLGRYRSGFGLVALTLALLAMILAAYALGLPSSFSGYIFIVITLFSGTFLLYAVSIALSWKWSASVAHPDQHRGRHWYGLLGLWIVLMIPVQLVSATAQTFYRSFRLSAESMAPMLQTGDQFLAHMRNFDPIQQGDIVIVRLGAFDHVKRVAAIPGDTIAMRDGLVILNGKPVPQQTVRGAGGSPGAARLLREKFPGETGWHIIQDLRPTPQDSFAEVHLGENRYFLLGDNRDNSMDSRFGPNLSDSGIITREQIRGRALFRYWRKGPDMANSPL